MQRRASPATPDGRAPSRDPSNPPGEGSAASEASARVDLRSRTSIPPASVAARVSQRHAELARLDHFALLGVPKDADRDTIRRAFQQNARAFHPDRLHGDDERLRPLAAAIFRRLTDAYRVLDDDASRERYQRQLECRGRTSVPPGGSLEADPERLYQTARLCLKRGQHEDAKRLIRLACEADPERADCQALRAWLLVQSGGELRPGPVADRILRLLTRAIGGCPDDLELRMDRGRVLSRLGRAADALRDFCFVSRADPGHVDAAREKRLHELRCAQKPTLSSVFTRLVRPSTHDRTQRPRGAGVDERNSRRAEADDAHRVSSVPPLGAPSTLEIVPPRDSTLRPRPRRPG
jgi:tetratricopeptide (TPR) repeat protein